MQTSRKFENVVLIGFMGSGKTSVGMCLAEMLKMSFIDTDTIIEQDSKMSIPEIFSRMGEAHFRELESKAVEKVCRLRQHIIATGGGAIVREQNFQYLRSTGMLFYLDATPEVILQRTSQHSNRPLLMVEDPVSQIRKLLQTREPFYAKADYRIDTSQFTIKQVAEKIADLFRSHPSQIPPDPPLAKGGI